MGKCVRIRSSSSKPPAHGEAGAAAYLTLRSGRRVPVAAAPCSSPPAGSRRHRRGSRTISCRCGGGTKQRACGSPGRRRKSAEPRKLAGGRDRPEEDAELPSSEPASNTPLHSGDVVEKAEHEHGSKGGGVEEGRAPPWSMSPQLEAEMEAFFAAAELAERRRFAEAYNYDVALDRPLEGRFEWAPVST
ncbi:unnamed protein product [Urochloa humidicola]